MCPDFRSLTSSHSMTHWMEALLTEVSGEMSSVSMLFCSIFYVFQGHSLKTKMMGQTSKALLLLFLASFQELDECGRNRIRVDT